MKIIGLTLLISDKPDIERNALATVWEKHGGEAIRLAKFWSPPELDPTKVRVYGNDSFCQVLAQILNLHLISPPDDFLQIIDDKWCNRDVEFMQLSDAYRASFPSFFKSAVPKLFASKVYDNADGLSAECKGLDEATVVIQSEVVEFTNEARAFILDGEVTDLAFYEGNGSHDEALDFLRAFLIESDKLIPVDTYVLDIGYIPNRGWAVIEANASWGAGQNGCDPEKTYECVARAVDSN